MLLKNYLVLFTFMTFGLTQMSAQWIFGGGLKYNTNKEFIALGINAKVGKDISEKFDANLDISHYIGSKATWSMDFALHYRLFNIDDKVIINPVGGIIFTKTDLINNSLALGASIRIPSDRFTYYIEPKWVLDNEQILFSVGVLF